jgi:transposase-like protein
MNSKKTKAIELLALGGQTNRNIATAVGVNEATLYKWLKLPEFHQQVINRSREILKGKLPNLYSIATEQAMNGSAQHLKILMDHLDKLEERAVVSQRSSLSFTWANTPTTNTTIEEDNE